MTRIEHVATSLGAADRVALIAGSGRLPVDVAEGLEAAGKPPFVILLEGEAVETGAFAPYERISLPVEAIGGLVPLLRRNKITHLVMAGGAARRPKVTRIHWNFALLRLVPRVVAALAQGDNGLLSAIVHHLEDNGIKVLGPHEILPHLLARAGPMTRARPQRADRRDLAAAMEAALAIGRLDVGQAAVAIGGRAVALEGIEGTDGLLERVRDLRSHGRLAGRARGVLVKCAKPGQEVRADLPSIGPGTVERAHAAGLAGVGVEAGRALVLDYAQTIERADTLGLFVVGLEGATAP